MAKIKISVVSYINSIPFLYGLDILNENDIIIERDVPSDCAEKIIQNRVDIGLVPVAIIPELNKYTIITDFCIGSIKSSKTVLLLSNTSLKEIKNIYLDNESKTSAMLAKILAKRFWNINPQWHSKKITSDDKTDAIVVIGDKTFNLSGKYEYQYDLTAEWFKYTQLPFVFACWVANKELSENFLTKFNHAITFGIIHKTEALKKYLNNKIPFYEAEDYINNYISYEFDEAKKKGMNLFFSYLHKI